MPFRPADAPLLRTQQKKEERERIKKKGEKRGVGNRVARGATAAFAGNLRFAI